MLNFLQSIYSTVKYRALCSFREADMEAARIMLRASNTCTDREKELLSRVLLQIHPFDGMYTPSAPQHYLSVGLSAIRCIDEALETESSPPIQSVLDFASGYGRVLRFLRVRFPDAEIFGCELKRPAIDFCRRYFDVNAIRSAQHFSKLELHKQFDLIWCGSLLTHIDEQAASQLLNFFYKHLSPGGICVYTTHGPSVVERIRKREYSYRLTAEAQKNLIEQFEAQDYAYVDHKNKQGYGISAVRRSKMLALADRIGRWKEIFYREKGWDDHQDVYAFKKNG